MLIPFDVKTHRSEKTCEKLYVLLVIVRLLFALSPSYLHPDEHFQGPEIIAGDVFSFPVYRTWEFTSETPIRSVFPLYLIYGLALTMLRIGSATLGLVSVDPTTAFRLLRLCMFLLSSGLGDRAIWELVDSPRQRWFAVLLSSSSYVTWTWQVHTFSNSIETILVLWTLVFMKRMANSERSNFPQSLLLAFLIVLGIFNRITFPAFILVPALVFLSKTWHRAAMMANLTFAGLSITFAAVMFDGVYYAPPNVSLLHMLRNPIITPLNNLFYNTKSSNLAMHGTHPRYQHLLINLPELLGPAILLLFTTPSMSMNALAALSGTCFLSCFSHQEARFLLPAVPLVLASVRLPQRLLRPWIAVWIIFNIFLGLFMGIFHQGGVIPAQLFISTQPHISEAYWWKTYSPPTWLLGSAGANINTIDLMGLDRELLEDRLCTADRQNRGRRVIVAPSSSTFLDQFITEAAMAGKSPLQLHEIWAVRRHLNLDDMDFEADGVYHTLKRVIGRRGLTIWDVQCRMVS